MNCEEQQARAHFYAANGDQRRSRCSETFANTPISHVRPTTAAIGAAQQWKALEWHKSQLGMVNGEGCCAAEDGVVAELSHSHVVAVWIPQAPAAHVDALTFLLAHNHLNDVIRGIAHTWCGLQAHLQTCTIILYRGMSRSLSSCALTASESSLVSVVTWSTAYVFPFSFSCRTSCITDSACLGLKRFLNWRAWSDEGERALRMLRD